jgi:hypothetical protein
MTVSKKIGDVTFHVEDTWTASREGRAVFEWRAETEDELWLAQDLCGPVIGEPSEDEMLETLLSFVGAALESRAYRERNGLPFDASRDDNEQLFPSELLDQLDANDVDLACWELEERRDVLEHGACWDCGTPLRPDAVSAVDPESCKQCDCGRS